MKKCLKIFSAVAIFVLITASFAVMAHASTTMRVGLLRDSNNVQTITINSTTIEVGRGSGTYNAIFTRVTTMHSNNGFTVTANENGIFINAIGGGDNFQLVNTPPQGSPQGAPQIRAAVGNTISISSNTYYGVIEFRREGSNITAINVVNLEQYLYGVVGMEMSPGNPTEALRAQAVAARTFALYSRNRGRYTTRGFDICDRTCCQAYRGTHRVYASIRSAVRDTQGLVIYAPSGTVPLFTPYFASSGGATANSEHVWTANLSHLRGVLDPHEPNPRIWSRTFTWAQLTAAVQAQAPNANIGTVTGISVTRAHFGRVSELTFIGTNGQWTARGEAIRTMFGHVGGALDSQNFQIVGTTATTTGGTALTISITNGFVATNMSATSLNIVNHLGQISTISNAYVFDGFTTRNVNQGTTTFTGGTGVTLNGRGWGHGVGMSQQGAIGMAHQGYDFRTILRHFYTNIEIR